MATDETDKTDYVVCNRADWGLPRTLGSTEATCTECGTTVVVAMSTPATFEAMGVPIPPLICGQCALIEAGIPKDDIDRVVAEIKAGSN